MSPCKAFSLMLIAWLRQHAPFLETEAGLMRFNQECQLDKNDLCVYKEITFVNQYEATYPFPSVA